MRADERDVLQQAIRLVTEQGASADAIVDHAMAAGLDGSARLTIQVKQLRIAGRAAVGEGRVW
jgi:hypothetical protein